MYNLNLLVVGVGGQGVVLASDIIGEAALSAGYDVKKTDTLGMAQRGGSVISHVRLGKKVWSPLVKDGEADIILGFEKVEAARWLGYLRPGGVMLINNQEVPPLSVSLGLEKYPGDSSILEAVKQLTDRVFIIDGVTRVKELGNIKTLNVFMLGCVSDFIPLAEEVWRDCISRLLPEKIRNLNLEAFGLGRKELAGVNI